MTAFADRAKAHLALYKLQSLGVTEDGVWSRNQKTYPHILPASQAALNLLEPYRQDIVAHLESRGIKKHSDFHHLNSSQALALNLFYPALSEGEIAQGALLRALTGRPGTIGEWSFEAVLDRDEGTNFDLYLPLRSGGAVFVEVKYTEVGFGAAEANAERERKWERIYRPRLEGKIQPAYLESYAFFANYQLLRNLSYARGPDDTVVFVVPTRNRSAASHAEAILATAVVPGALNARLVHLEDVCRAVSALELLPGDRWPKHYSQFASKYLWEE